VGAPLASDSLMDLKINIDLNDVLARSDGIIDRRPHLKQVSERRRAFFALGLSSIFVQGSVLLCAMARRMSGDAIAASAPRMVLGAALAGGCLHFGKSYMELVDGDHDEELDGDDYDDEEEEEEVGLSDGAKETVAVA